jgi:hypothetical protein
MKKNVKPQPEPAITSAAVDHQLGQHEIARKLSTIKVVFTPPVIAGLTRWEEIISEASEVIIITTIHSLQIKPTTKDYKKEK